MINIMTLQALLHPAKEISLIAGKKSQQQTPEDSCMFQEKTVADMETFEVKVKIEAIRMFLESCMKDGMFQEEKHDCLTDFVQSLGWQIKRNFRSDPRFKINGSDLNENPHFRLTVDHCGQDVERSLNSNGQSFVSMTICLFEYQRVVKSSGDLQDIFRIKMLNEIRTKPLEKVTNNEDI